MAAFSSFWPSFPFLTFLLPRPFELASLVFFVILVRRFLLMLFSHNRRMSRISQIKRLTRQITDRQEGKRKQKWSQIAPRSSMPQFVAWPTDWFPGPPRAIAYLCTTRATLTALQTEDIWPIFCFSCPFMSFEAQRKSQYAKLIQFFVANFRLWSRCRHFLIEWPSFVAISFGRCRYFFAHVACRNLPWQGLLFVPLGFLKMWKIFKHRVCKRYNLNSSKIGGKLSPKKMRKKRFFLLTLSSVFIPKLSKLTWKLHFANICS